MKYQFYKEHATRYGVEEAIILANLAFWIEKNQANRRHFYEGRYWTYNSARAFAELFPWWSEKQIRRILTSLENQGAILVGEFNASGYNHTKWYALAGTTMFPNGQNDVPEWEEGSDQTGTSYTDSKPDSKPDGKHSLVENDSAPGEEGLAFDVFWNKYDKKQGKQNALKEWGKLKPAERLAAVAYIPAYHRTQPEKRYRLDPERYLKYKRWKDAEEVPASERRLIGYVQTWDYVTTEEVWRPVYEGDEKPKMGFRTIAQKQAREAELGRKL